MPVVKQIPRSKLPPQSVRNIRVRELKRERPLVAERKASVFRRGAAEKTMPVRKSKEPLRLEGRKFMGKETTPRREIQTGERPPARLKEKPVTPLEKRTAPLEKRTVTPLEKRTAPLEKRTVTPLEKRTAPLERSKQLQQPSEKRDRTGSKTIEKPETQIRPSGKRPVAEIGTTGMKRKVETSVEKQRGKAVESSRPRSTVEGPVKEQQEKEDKTIGR